MKGNIGILSKSYDQKIIHEDYRITVHFFQIT